MPSTRRGERGARCKKTGSEHSKRPRHCALPARLRRTMCTGSSFRYRTESRSTEDTWQRTTGPSCRPHESTTGEAGVSLTRSLSDSGPVPISLAVRAPLHLKSERTTPCALPSRRCRYCYPLRLVAAALQDPLHVVCVFGAGVDGGENRNPRFMRKHRSWSAVAISPSVQLDRLGDSRCTRRCRGYSSGRRSNWCSMRPCTARLPQGQSNEAQSECLTRPG